MRILDNFQLLPLKKRKEQATRCAAHNEKQCFFKKKVKSAQ